MRQQVLKDSPESSTESSIFREGISFDSYIYDFIVAKKIGNIIYRICNIKRKLIGKLSLLKEKNYNTKLYLFLSLFKFHFKINYEIISLIVFQIMIIFICRMIMLNLYKKNYIVLSKRYLYLSNTNIIS